MKKFFGLLVVAFVLSLSAYGMPAVLSEKNLTKYEKTAVPEDSVLVYGILALPFYYTPLRVLYTSPDLNKPNAPITHCVPKPLASSKDKVGYIGYYVVTGVASPDTPYEFIEWRAQTVSGRYRWNFVLGREEFGKSNADFRTQKTPGLQYLGVFNLLDEGRAIDDEAVAKAESVAIQHLAKLYGNTSFAEVLNSMLKEQQEKELAEKAAAKAEKEAAKAAAKAEKEAKKAAGKKSKKNEGASE